MLKILLLVMAVIMGLLGYKVYSNHQKTQTHHVTPQSQNITSSEKEAVENKINQVAETQITHTDDMPPRELDGVLDMESEKINTINKEEKEIDEELKDKSYKEIENDTSLSDEEREAMIIDKLYYEGINNPIPTSEPVSEEKMEKMILEDLTAIEE